MSDGIGGDGAATWARGVGGPRQLRTRQRIRAQTSPLDPLLLDLSKRYVDDTDLDKRLRKLFQVFRQPSNHSAENTHCLSPLPSARSPMMMKMNMDNALLRKEPRPPALAQHSTPTVPVLPIAMSS